MTYLETGNKGIKARNNDNDLIVFYNVHIFVFFAVEKLTCVLLSETFQCGLHFAISFITMYCYLLHYCIQTVPKINV